MTSRSQPNFSVLADQVECILDITQDKLVGVVIDYLFRGFLNSKEYEDYTKAPKGPRIYKKARGVYQKYKGQVKDSYQEFSWEHLDDAKERKKYGKKFLDTLTSFGIMTQHEYKMLLPETQKVYSHKNAKDPIMAGLLGDPLKLALVDYYLVPEFNEKLEELGAPYSGYKVFDKFRERLVGTIYPGTVVLLLETIHRMRAIREHRGDDAAMKFFYEEYFPKWMNDETLIECTPVGGKQFYESLRKEVQKPLAKIYMQLEDYKVDWAMIAENISKEVWHSKNEAVVKHYGFADHNNGTNEIHWV